MLSVVRSFPEFRRIWYAQVISSMGDWLNRVAVLTLIAGLGGGRASFGVGALFGVELAVRLLPSALFGPLAGPVADRVSRKLLMIASDLVRAGIVLLLLLVDAPDELPMLFVLLLAQMSAAIFFNAARSAAVPNTVSRESLHAAYALSAATWSAMLSVGALAGGLLIPLVGVRGVFVADAATYLISVGLLARLRLPPMPVQPERFRWRDVLLLTDLRRGWSHVRALRIAPAVVAKTFWGAAGGYLVVLSIAGSERFGAVAGGDLTAAFAATGFATGVLYSARGLGTGLGPILLNSLFGSSDRSLRRQISLGFLVGAAGYSLFALTTRFPVAVALVVLAHMGGSGLWVASTTFWQRHVADAYRGRVFALEFLGLTVAFSGGGLLAGLLYDGTGSLETTVFVLCALVVLLGVCWSLLARGMEGPREDVVSGHAPPGPETRVSP